MPEQQEPSTRSLLKNLWKARRRAKLALTTERVTQQGWRLLLWVFLFAGLWLFQLPDFFGRAGSIGTLVLFIGGLAYFFRKDVRAVLFPDKSEIDRRIEQDSALPHRPLNALKDSLANPRKMESRSLWHINRHKAVLLLHRIRPSFPRPFLPPADPYALRFAVLLFFGLGIFTAGADWKVRIVNGLTPFSLAADGLPKSGIRLVITPPEYTGLAQVILEGGRKGMLEIPTGSMLKATVHGGIGRPYMKVDDIALPFDAAGKGNYILEMTAPMGQRLSIRRFFIPRASWNYTLIPDTPPDITMGNGLEILPDGTFRVPLAVEDDYGVSALVMRVELDETAAKPALGKPVTEMRSILSAPKTPLKIQPVYDLTAHPWAGLPVTVTFTAEDHLAQKSGPQTLLLTLPEREFTHDVAKQLIGLRKLLIAKPLENYQEIIDQIESIIARPDSFRRDNLVLLSLRASASRLFWAGPSEETAEGVVALLWDTALRLEDGNLSIAARNLREAQTALENALRDPGTSNEEMAQLMQNLRMAMAQYFMELQREMQKRIAQGQPLPFIPSEMLAKMIDPETLAAMLNQMESQMMSGDRKSAQEMLSQLENMMDMMSPSMMQLPQDMQQLMEASKEMQELIERQQTLLDQTSAQAGLQDQTGSIERNFGEILPEDKERLKSWGIEDMPPPPQIAPGTPDTPIVDTRENQKEQEFLRYTLGRLMLKAGEAMDEIPENMGLAEYEMRNSSRELGDNSPALSVPYQKEVLRLLKEARQQMNQDLAQRLKQMTGLAFGGSGMKYDPLGRPYGGDGNEDGPHQGSSVKIPDEAERKRAQEILRLLQKRSGEFGRPDQELEYYRRLLKQF